MRVRVVPDLKFRLHAFLVIPIVMLGGSIEDPVGIHGGTDGTGVNIGGERRVGDDRRTPAKRPPVARTRPMDPGECWLAELTANRGVAFWCSAAIGESAGCGEDERFRVPYLRSVWDAATGA